jgi:UDP-N-acetylmuramate dehydrogenase
MDIQTVSLKNYSSLRIGGEGKVITVTNTAELVEALMYAKHENFRVHIIGGGTNSYFGEDLQNYIFISIKIKGVSLEMRESDCLIKAYSGEVWDDIVQFSTEKELWGIENLSLIPGTAGATPIQNIGAYGVELKDVFVSLSAIDMQALDLVEIAKEACQFGYRDSLFKKEVGRYVVVSVTLNLSTEPRPVLTYKPLDELSSRENITSQQIREKVIAIRKAKLPDWKESPNAGSFFKNPIISKEGGDALREKYPGISLIDHTEGYKVPAAWLIEHVAEMKGVRRGDLGTWPSQPLVIVNYGNATADDVDNFAGEIRSKIFTATGLLLEQEVNRVG